MLLIVKNSLKVERQMSEKLDVSLLINKVLLMCVGYLISDDAAKVGF